MSVSDKTHYNLKRMHVLFAAAALALLVATVSMLIADYRRPWKEYQRQYYALTGQPQSELTIEQIWLPELTLDYNFRQVARSDRCTTCHLGIDQPSAVGLPQPFAAHPRLDLFLGAKSPHLLLEFGCTVCHDGQGSATNFHWASHTPNDRQQRQRWHDNLGWSANPNWDYPMLARRFQQSRCLTCHQNVTDLEPSRRFPDPPAAKLVEGYQLVRQYGCFGCHEMPVFREVGHKVGPSLRNIGGKLNPSYVVDRIRNPFGVLPTTRMPRMFGMWEHLEGQSLADAQQSEDIEVWAVAQYLLASAEKVAPSPTPSGAIESPSAERGKHLFQTQGCLACHQHRDFPTARANQGPDLSSIGAKYLAGSGAIWLTGWLRDTTRYSPETLMPNPLLPPVLTDTDGKTTDPAADLTTFLFSKATPTSQTIQSFDDASVSLGREVIARRGCFGCHDIPGFESAERIGPSLSNWGRKPESLLSFDRVGEFVERSTPSDCSADDGFYRDALLAHRSEGFLWQKLRMPRSFDYKTADGRPVGEHLKMGQFALSDTQREAIITFVLGLTDESPAAKYVYWPDPRQSAIIEGRKVFEKYACAECHMLGLERWTLDHKTELSGVPRLATSGALQQDEDDDGQPVYFFTLWEPATVDGQVRPVGGADVVVPKARLTAMQPPWGGALARLLYPVVLSDARRSGSSAAEIEAWGWLPPTLVHEGAVVRPEWLFRYLMDPTVVRPASVLRMPRFNLSSAEARKLTDYFAAASGVEYPYTAKSTAAALPLDMARLDKAAKLLTDRDTYCAKCHLIGDYRPVGQNITMLAPRLDDVGSRIRPEYVRRWLADPKSVLPYTAMPSHFPSSGDPLGQDLFPGSSREQLDAVTELLIRYDEYIKRRAAQ